MFFDSHCHFDFPEFDQSRDQLWKQCLAAGVNGLLIPGTQPSAWNKQYRLTKELPGAVSAVGIHPWWVKDLPLHQLVPDDMATLMDFLAKPSCVAIGECGLDAVIDTPLSTQQIIFEQQLRLACDYKKPLIIHCRKAHNLMIELLIRYRPPSGGVIHGFSGSIELAKQYQDLGFYLGIGGTISYERAAKTRRTVQLLPLDAMVLETDSPDMPLYGKQGQINTPLNVVEVAKVLAHLRQDTVDNIAYATTANVKALFKL